MRLYVNVLSRIWCVHVYLSVLFVWYLCLSFSVLVCLFATAPPLISTVCHCLCRHVSVVNVSLPALFLRRENAENCYVWMSGLLRKKEKGWFFSHNKFLVCNVVVTGTYVLFACVVSLTFTWSVMLMYQVDISKWWEIVRTTTWTCQVFPEILWSSVFNRWYHTSVLQPQPSWNTCIKIK